MAKNIVFMTAIENAPDKLDYKKYCYNTWQYWCNKNDVEMQVITEPLYDVNKMKPTWQRWYVFDLLESNNIDYNQVALIDIDTMIHWDCPNFFEMTNDKFSAIRNDFDVNWVYKSIEGYKHLFPNTDLNWTEYFNCGVIIMNKKHKKLCNDITNFYFENKEELLKLQHETLKKGSDQTPVNYLVKKSEFDLNYLDKRYNMSQMHKLGVLSDLMWRTGYIWHFNGFSKKQRNIIMKNVWQKIRGNYEIE